jgi:hypothetical protein
LKLRTVEVTAHSPHSASTLFERVADTAGWPKWSRATEAELEQPGSTDREGVGAIRRFRTSRIVSREEVVAFEPPHHFAYIMLSGLPLVGYRADVTFEPHPAAGTVVRWRSTFRPRYRGSGWLNERMLRRFLQDTAERLAGS